MSGFRGIFLDAIHPLIVKRLDADTNAFKQMAIVKSSQQVGDYTKTTATYTNSVEGMNYYSERKVWMRAVPFAIAQTEYTTDKGLVINNLPTVPEWRDWVIWGTKAAHIHGEGVPYGSGDDNGTGRHSNQISGWHQKHGEYRVNRTAWDGTEQSGVINSPVPGITNLQVSNKGDLGTIRRASFDIKVHNLADLEAIEMMYMVPGLSILIEWGWFHPKLYVDPINVELIKDGDRLASTSLINTEILKKSFGVDDEDQIGDATPLYNLEEAATTDFGPLGPRAGIYDGLLGVVTKFNWTNDGQGGYDCRIDVISPGSLAGGIPAESYNLGGEEVVEGESVPVSDIRTVITSIRKDTRALEIKPTNDARDDKLATNLKGIEIIKNAGTGQATFASSKDYKIEINPDKLQTSTYGIKITKDTSTDPPTLIYTKVKEDAKDNTDYYVSKYKGGNKERVLKIRGDRTWWNKVIAYAMGKDVTQGEWSTGLKSGKELIETNNFKISGAEIEDIAAKFNSFRTRKLMDIFGYNETETLAVLERDFGDAFRNGQYYVTRRSNGEPNIHVKSNKSYVTRLVDSFDNFAFNELDSRGIRYWFPHATIWRKGSYYADRNKSKAVADALTPAMEEPGHEDKGTEYAKIPKVPFLQDIVGATTIGDARWHGYGWKAKDDTNSKTRVDDTGETMIDSDAPWGEDNNDPVLVQAITGTTVYKKDADGNYAEVASLEGFSASDIAQQVREEAESIEASKKEAEAQVWNETHALDVAITTAATNFGNLSWGGPFPDDDKPVRFGDAKYHVGIYAKVHPAFAPKRHDVEGSVHTAELGYEVLQGEQPGFPIGMVAYSETYLSWRWVEDYLLSELYMPRAVQPGVDSNSTHTELDTIFLSANRLSDNDKNKLSTEFTKKFSGLIKKTQGGLLDDDSRARELYHSQHIINHPELRSFNPEVCILPGQESIPEIFKSEDVPEIKVKGSQHLLDHMGEDICDPEISGVTALNKFAGLDTSGEIDRSRGVLRNIMINANLLEEVALKSDNVRKFCLTVLDKVNTACGKPWKFKMLTNSALGKISIIDENYTPVDNVSDYGMGITNFERGDGSNANVGVYKFTGIGANNILKDVKIQSKIPNELQTMAYYATLGSASTKGEGIQMFNMYRAGVVDRLRSISNVVVLSGDTETETTRKEATAKLISGYSKLFPQTRKNITQGLKENGAAEEGVNVAKQYVTKYIHGNTIKVGGYRPPIPIDVSLSLHGVSGIFMGNAVMIKTIDEGGILPSRYRKNIALQATSVDHSITPETWTTEIGTLMRPLSNVTNEAEVQVMVKNPPAFLDEHISPDDYTGQNGNATFHDLVSINSNPLNPLSSKFKVNREAGVQYTKMIRAMFTEDSSLAAKMPVRPSGFRTYKGQYDLIDQAHWEETGEYKKKDTNGKVKAAPPGRSNHGLGKAIDFGHLAGNYDCQNWIQNNGIKWGWSWYTSQGGEGQGINEPWHFKYLPGKATL